MPRYPRNNGYIGIGKQSVKGTAVVPTQFVKWINGATMTPEISFTTYQEGDSQFPGPTLKELHKPNGNFEALVRPKLAGLIFTLLLGTDTLSGTGPYTHTIKPSESASLPWATIERSIAGQLIEQIVDARINEITIKGESGKPITITVNYQALTSKDKASAENASYEVNDPFIFWQGVYTADGVDVSSEISSFEINITNVIDENEQGSDIVREALTLVRREISANFTYKMTDSNAADYDDLYYNAADTPNTSMLVGSLNIAISYGSGADAKSLEIDIPRVIHTARKIELDAGSDETQAFECEGIAEKDSAQEFITVTIENADSAAY